MFLNVFYFNIVYTLIYLLACLFRRKSQIIVIARLLLSSSVASCKNIMLPITQKVLKLSIPTLEYGILTQHDKLQLQDKGHNSNENYRFGVMLHFI